MESLLLFVLNDDLKEPFKVLGVYKINKQTEKWRVRPYLSSNTGPSYREMEKLGVRDLATDTAYVNFRKRCSYSN